MAFENHAAYLVNKENKPLEVRSAPYTKPGPEELVIRARAVAINPIDLIMQVSAKLAFSYIPNLHVLGHDVAGDIVEVGANVQAENFNPGDRVVGHAIGYEKRSRGAPEGAFQEYVLLRTNLTAKLPDTVSYEHACVIPLGLSTAACGLFQKDYLGLAHPQSPRAKSQGKTVLIWGGSTSVGSNGIQLARAAGYDVVATASSKNFEYVKELGATEAFDYNDSATPAKIIEYLKGRTCAGALAIGSASLEPCVSIISAAKGAKFVAQCSIPLDMTAAKPGMLELVRVMLLWRAKMAVTARMKGVATKTVTGTDLVWNEVGKVCYPEFLGQALAQGEYVPKPEPLVVGHGLEAVQEAFEYYRKDKVSVRKLVVML